MVNGDTFAEIDYRAMLHAHRAADAQLSIAIVQVADAGRYGSIEVSDGMVRRFHEKGTSGPGWINGGVYVMGEALRARLPSQRPFSFEHEILMPGAGTMRILAFRMSGTFIDIGVPADYTRAQTLLGAANIGMKNRALLLDRDGVVNVDRNYVSRIEEFEFMPGIFELCATAQALGFLPIVITNQAGIGRGYYTEDDFRTLSTWMVGEFANRGIRIARIYHCPYHPTEGVGEYRRESFDRKPNPGMILRARADFDLDLASVGAGG